jgi:predicted SprT family Zn-dependent metalloprotease
MAASTPNDASQTAELDAFVLARALREVKAAYYSTNQSLFSGKLRLPLLEWSHEQAELGAWIQATRTLRLNANLARGPWGTLIEVLKHEMAHQFVSEVLLIAGETPHGGAFRRVCDERGIDPRSKGMPNATETLETEASRVLERVRRLLSLANSENQNEAEAAMAAARRLMLKHNIEEARSGAVPYRFRHLGPPTGRRQAWQRTLANILSGHFFVEVIIVPVFDVASGKSASVVEICGTETNLEVASYAHEFLDRSARELWKDRKRRLKAEAGGKNAFLLGVMSGFESKLSQDRKGDRGEGLVWLGDPQLNGYLRRRHPYIRTVSGRGLRRDGAFEAGRAAGRELVLRRGISEGPSNQPPRLLRG